MNAEPKGVNRRADWRREHAFSTSPEEVLLQWLLWLPAGADPAAAALAELRRPELRQPTDPLLVRLAALLQGVAANAAAGCS